MAEPQPFTITVGGLPWRVGRKVGRTIYDSEDHLIGVMDTRSLAAEVVAAVNGTGDKAGDKAGDERG